MALARQRLLTATFSYYQLKDEPRGLAGGFVYVRKRKRRGLGLDVFDPVTIKTGHRPGATSRRSSWTPTPTASAST